MIQSVFSVFMNFTGFILFFGCLFFVSCCKKSTNKPNEVQQQPNPATAHKVEVPKGAPTPSQNGNQSKVKKTSKQAAVNPDKDKNIGNFDKVHKNLVTDTMADKFMSSAAIRRQREVSMKEKISSGFYVAPTQEDDTLKEYPEPEEENTEGDATNKSKKKKKKSSATNKKGEEANSASDIQ